MDALLEADSQAGVMLGGYAWANMGNAVDCHPHIVFGKTDLIPLPVKVKAKGLFDQCIGRWQDEIIGGLG